MNYKKLLDEIFTSPVYQEYRNPDDENEFLLNMSSRVNGGQKKLTDEQEKRLENIWKRMTPVMIQVECPKCKGTRMIQTIEGDGTRYSLCRSCRGT